MLLRAFPVMSSWPPQIPRPSGKTIGELDCDIARAALDLTEEEADASFATSENGRSRIAKIMTFSSTTAMTCSANRSRTGAVFGAWRCFRARSEFHDLPLPAATRNVLYPPGRQ